MFRIAVTVTVVVFYLESTLARPKDEKYIYNASMPDSCSAKSYCFEKDNNYPAQENIETILNKVESNLWIELGSDYIGIQPGGFIENDCRTVISVGPIYEIVDVEGRVRYVVQSPNRFKQILRVEECLNPGRLLSRTLHFIKSDLQNNHLSCDETRINYSFLVLTPDLEGVEMVQSKNGIPICCNCVYHAS